MDGCIVMVDFLDFNFDFLMCGLCYKWYNDLCILDCFYIYCCECLERYVYSIYFKVFFLCLLCYMDIYIFKVGVKGFY